MASTLECKCCSNYFCRSLQYKTLIDSIFWFLSRALKTPLRRFLNLFGSLGSGGWVLLFRSSQNNFRVICAFFQPCFRLQMLHKYGMQIMPAVHVAPLMDWKLSGHHCVILVKIMGTFLMLGKHGSLSKMRPYFSKLQKCSHPWV